MILSYLLSGDIRTALINLLVLLFVIFCINPVHEYAHAFVAYKLGDNTAKAQGRLTLNPIASFDLIGTLMFLIVGFGWAKPVPINPRNFKKLSQRAGTVLTAAAGPLSNLIVAFLASLATVACIKYAPGADYLADAFEVMAMINVVLAVFNLIPLPPLDGSRVLAGILPDKYYFKLFKYDRYIRNGLMALMLISIILRRMTGIDLFTPLYAAEQWILGGFLKLACLIFGVAY